MAIIFWTTKFLDLFILSYSKKNAEFQSMDVLQPLFYKEWRGYYILVAAGGRQIYRCSCAFVWM
jgi:hypothetical protein